MALTVLPLIVGGMITVSLEPVYAVMVMFVPSSEYVKSPYCPALADIAKAQTINAISDNLNQAASIFIFPVYF
jgi:hypothetical protein